MYAALIRHFRKLKGKIDIPVRIDLHMDFLEAH